MASLMGSKARTGLGTVPRGIPHYPSLFPGRLRHLPLHELSQHRRPRRPGRFPAPGAVPVPSPGGGVPAAHGAAARGPLFRKFALLGRQRLVSAHLVVRRAIQTGASGRSIRVRRYVWVRLVRDWGRLRLCCGLFWLCAVRLFVSGCVTQKMLMDCFISDVGNCKE